MTENCWLAAVTGEFSLKKMKLHDNEIRDIDPPFDGGPDFSMDIEIGSETLTSLTCEEQNTQ